MYLIRRVAKTQPGKSWQVAGYLAKICAAYEEGGRDRARIYVGNGLPGDQNVAYAEWTQERIEPNPPGNVPKAIFTLHREMMEHVTSYDLEFYEVATAEKLAERGLG